MKIPGYYTAPEIMARFAWSRDMVSKTARARGWEYIAIGRSRLFLAGPVDEYATDRQRTELLRQTGWVKVKGSQLVRDDTYDSTCPVCGAYAVEKLAASGADMENIEWLCENGHSHK